jgi:hypothetical protein
MRRSSLYKLIKIYVKKNIRFFRCHTFHIKICLFALVYLHRINLRYREDFLDLSSGRRTCWVLWYYIFNFPITVAARSKAWTVFARSNNGIMGLNPTRGMDVCLHLFCVCIVLCVGSSLTRGWSPVQGVLPTMYRLRNWKSGQGPQGL